MHLQVNQVPTTNNGLAAQSLLQSSLVAHMKTETRRRNLQFDLAPLQKGAAAQAQNHLLPFRSLLSNMATLHNRFQQPHHARKQLSTHLRSLQLVADQYLSLLRNLPSLLPQRAVHHPLSLPKFPGMPAPPLKVLNLHQPLGPAERFLLLRQPRIAHMAEQRGINHILIPLHVGQAGLEVPPLLRGDDLGLEPLTREVILGPDPLSGVGPGLPRGGEDLEAPSGVAALGLLSVQAGPGAEITREEAGLGQQGEVGHTLDLQPPGVDLVLEHQLDGVGPALEHLSDGDLDPERLPDVGLGLEHQPGGADLVREHLLGADLGPGHRYAGDHVLGHQLGEVAGHGLEPLPGVAAHVLEHQPEE